MIFALVKGFLSLLGLGNWAEKLWGDHEIKETGITEEKLSEDGLVIQQQQKDLEAIKNANEMADSIRNDPAERKRVYDALNGNAANDKK
jgi:hypothetical protein